MCYYNTGAYFFTIKLIYTTLAPKAFKAEDKIITLRDLVPWRLCVSKKNQFKQGSLHAKN